MNQPPQIHEPRARPAKLTGQAPGFGAHDLTESVAARVQDILASAHETAEGVREQVAVATRDMLAQAQATVDRDTERIRRDVEARAAQYLAECHRRVDAFADARVRRLRELSDSLIEQTDALHGRFTQVVRLSEQLDALLGALGGAAEQTAREVKRPAISLPTMAQFHGESNGEPRDRSAVPPASTDDDEAPTEAGVPEASAATDLATASTEGASAEATSTDAASTAAPGTQGRSDPATGGGADGGESR
ncbi:MAG TPA: hypothetical protein VG165_03455 [Solirubrobacteraceae bacterium]|nr:hypothetical protein [Solirubrobacteraceae bacterium]